jgi:hypothetical protein
MATSAQFDADGTMHLVGTATPDSSNPYLIIGYYLQRRPDGIWSPLYRLTPPGMKGISEFSSYWPSLWSAPDQPAGTVSALWGAGGSGVFAQLGLPEVREVNLSLSVTIPAGMRSPTLSVMVRAQPVVLTPDVAALLTVNGVTVKTCPIRDLAWVHYWADLSPWAGQTVTVGISSHGTFQSGQVDLFVDDVSLGSYTIPEVTQVAPAFIPSPGAVSVLTLTGNFLPATQVTIGGRAVQVTYLNPTTLEVKLPADLPLGRYDLKTADPNGETFIISGAIAIGQQTFLSIVSR